MNMSLLIEVFLVLESENPGSTPMALMALSAYFSEGKGT